MFEYEMGGPTLQSPAECTLNADFVYRHSTINKTISGRFHSPGISSTGSVLVNKSWVKTVLQPERTFATHVIFNTFSNLLLSPAGCDHDESSRDYGKNV